VPASLPFGRYLKQIFYTGCTSCHNLIFARLVQHMEFMEHGEPMVKPDITGIYNYIIYASLYLNNGIKRIFFMWNSVTNSSDKYRTQTSTEHKQAQNTNKHRTQTSTEHKQAQNTNKHKTQNEIKQSLVRVYQYLYKCFFCHE